MKNGGWWHQFGEPEIRREARRPRPELLIQPTEPAPDFGAMMQRWRETSDPEHWDMMAASLGLAWRDMWWLAPAWSVDRGVMAFPMYDGANASEHSPCGIRLRTLDGKKKFAVTGSKAGVFFPWRALLSTMTRWPVRRLVICEGPTDTIACLSLGLFAIGRASCRGGEEQVISIVDQIAAEVVIVSDNDGPGVEGADCLARAITKPLWRITPPTKDMRAFVRDGGTKEVFDLLLKNSFKKSSTQK